MFNIISWIVFGLIIGAIAKFLIPGADGGSWLNTILLGIAGSFVGGFLGNLLFKSKGENAVRYGGWIMSIAGAIGLQLVIRYFFR